MHTYFSILVEIAHSRLSLHGRDSLVISYKVYGVGKIIIRLYVEGMIIYSDGTWVMMHSCSLPLQSLSVVIENEGFYLFLFLFLVCYAGP